MSQLRLQLFIVGLSVMSEKNKKYQRRKKSFLKRFFGNDDGVVAIEFAALALPFIAIIVVTFETATVFLASMVMDRGMSQAARFIQTGQASQVSLSEDGFKALVCDSAVILPNCLANIKVDVTKFDEFTDAEFPSMRKPNGDLKEDEDFNFDIGQAESTIVVRVAYEWPILSSNINSGLGNMNNGNRLLISSWAFKNEPF